MRKRFPNKYQKGNDKKLNKDKNIINQSMLHSEMQTKLHNKLGYVQNQNFSNTQQT